MSKPREPGTPGFPATARSAESEGGSPEVPSPVAGTVSALGETVAGSAVTPVVSSPRSFPIARWDRYEFLKLLGQGGMGAVYLARDRRLNRLIALKFLLGSDEQMILRFLQEARAQARIDHPAICKISVGC
jgi:serine/threonine-protein kinase